MNTMSAALQDFHHFLPTARDADWPRSGHTEADSECTEVCAMLNEAWAAVEQMDGSLFDDSEDKPQTFSFCDTSDSGEAMCDTEIRFPEFPIDAAAVSGRLYEVYLGLMTVCGLIEISQVTLRRSTLSDEANDEAWLALASDSKAAGHAAYMAVLQLVDPHADQFADPAPRGASAKLN